MIIISSSIACAIPGHGCQPGRVSDDGQRLSKDIQVRCFTNQDIWELRGQDKVGSWGESGIKKKKKSRSHMTQPEAQKKRAKGFPSASPFGSTLKLHPESGYLLPPPQPPPWAQLCSLSHFIQSWTQMPPWLQGSACPDFSILSSTSQPDQCFISYNLNI